MVVHNEKRDEVMDRSRVNAIIKLAVAGEHAGFSLEQMIQLLDSGMSVVALLDLINWRLSLAEISSPRTLIRPRAGIQPSSLRGHEMTNPDRYLHFDNIDMNKPDISSQCSHCGLTFKVEPMPSERVDDVLLRIRAQFDAHLCREVLMQAS